METKERFPCSPGYLTRVFEYFIGFKSRIPTYNVKNLDNATELVREYEKGLAQRGR